MSNLPAFSCLIGCSRIVEWVELVDKDSGLPLVFARLSSKDSFRPGFLDGKPFLMSDGPNSAFSSIDFIGRHVQGLPGRMRHVMI